MANYFFRQYYTKMATVQHKKPRNSAGWRWNSNRKRGPASYLRWYISTSLYIENRVESLWTSLCTLPRLRFPYMQELQQGMNQQPLCAVVLYYSQQASSRRLCCHFSAMANPIKLFLLCNSVPRRYSVVGEEVECSCCHSVAATTVCEQRLQCWHKSFHILHQLGGFDNDDARIFLFCKKNLGGGRKEDWLQYYNKKCTNPVKQ